ncbi:hypothetical protein [Nocardioides sp.]|uniref:hypothetical protein n=1 Tax=Nocardioides sp. TaxID=35761 RepID=UPI001A34D98A|nr:hypothetical protein [Nocardioides sp.]MBJ7356904.1 hypothetical protein [Nocardioides sp.]
MAAPSCVTGARAEIEEQRTTMDMTPSAVPRRTLSRPVPGRRGHPEAGKVAPHVGAIALVVLIVGVGVWTSTRAGDDTATPGTSPTQSGQPSASTPAVEDCVDTGRVPLIDLGVQAATGDDTKPQLTYEEVGALVTLAKAAGADVISTTASFRALQPREGGSYRFEGMDRVISAARDAGLEVRLRLMLMPRWALDEPNGTLRQPPRSDAELAHWAQFVGDVMRHVDGEVAFVEVWNEPNAQKYWTTGPDPVEFARLLDTTYDVVKEAAPEATVISGGLNGNDIGFLEKTYEAMETIGLETTPFDQLGVHPFAGAAAPEEIDPGEIYERDPYGLFDANFTGFETLHDVMADNGDEGLPLYLTAFGYSTQGSRTTPPVDDATRARYLGEALDIATCADYVAGVSWYAFHPTPWDPPAWTLLDARSKPNLTYAALQEWADSAPE